MLSEKPLLAKVIVAEAHRAGKPVFAHVSNNQGIKIAIQSEVDRWGREENATPWTRNRIAPVFAAKGKKRKLN
jgi:imidazolonepropionase-like amidohydrolase